MSYIKKFTRTTLLLLAGVFLLTIASVQAEAAVKEIPGLAVARPKLSGDLKESDGEALWGMIEASIKTDGYKVISRNALKAIFEEAGFTQDTDLVAMSPEEQAKLGQVSGVRYLLVPELAKFDSAMTLSLLLVDITDGGVNQQQSAMIRVASLSELTNKLQFVLDQLLNGAGKQRIALLSPVLKLKEYPEYLSDDLNDRLEEIILTEGLPLQNLKSVNTILHENGITSLTDVPPSTYVTIGNLLQGVDYLVQFTINRYSIETITTDIEVTKNRVTKRIGALAGSLRVISTKTGEVVAVFPFNRTLNFSRVRNTTDWVLQDYVRYLIEQTTEDLGQKLVTKLKSLETPSEKSSE